MRQRTAHKGLTMIELAVVIMVVVTMSAAGVVAYQDIVTSSDAQSVNSTQAALQTVISQAAARLEVSPQALCGAGGVTVGGTTYSQANVINALPMNVEGSIRVISTGANQFKASVPRGDYVIYQVRPNGDVVATSKYGFSGYSIVDGKLSR